MKLPLRDFYDMPEAAKIISDRLGEQCLEKDVRHYVRLGHLPAYTDLPLTTLGQDINTKVYLQIINVEPDIGEEGVALYKEAEDQGIRLGWYEQHDAPVINDSFISRPRSEGLWGFGRTVKIKAVESSSFLKAQLAVEDDCIAVDRLVADFLVYQVRHVVWSMEDTQSQYASQSGNIPTGAFSFFAHGINQEYEKNASPEIRDYAYLHASDVKIAGRDILAFIDKSQKSEWNDGPVINSGSDTPGEREIDNLHRTIGALSEALAGRLGASGNNGNKPNASELARYLAGVDELGSEQPSSRRAERPVSGIHGMSNRSLRERITKGLRAIDDAHKERD
ncbi:hypothetical protein IT895_01135 [Halomonas sp. A40-4]|uniref:hypothetical protein n=1 Tax=Halomonas sp. A40-4 TaxID=2785909 RepID=UPI0018F01E11|nr:hypothetical protein [Halomonas sp. A40-4]QPL46466.1 hypothetical protein IT895_01135 [Halomonas sp. A40-4]